MGFVASYLFNNLNITEWKIKKYENISYDINFVIVKNKLKNSTQPFDFDAEFLFFTNLISCKIPFSFIRFGDGENSIMKGDKLDVIVDKWHWNPKNKRFQDSLIESSSICTNHNSFIGIPCKNWIDISKSILSFSKCSLPNICPMQHYL